MSDLPRKDRAAKWSAVFSDKTVRATYTHKGHAMKSLNPITQKWHYSTCCGNFLLHGLEGESRGLQSKVVREAHHSRHTLGLGTVCGEADQSNETE